MTMQKTTIYALVAVGGVAGLAVLLTVLFPMIGLLSLMYILGEHGRTWLHDAAERNDPAAVHRLVRFGWDINASLMEPSGLEHSGWSGRTPLMLAAARGYFLSAQALVDEGADIYREAEKNKSTPYYRMTRTAFDDAVSGGNPDIVKLLWDKSDRKTFRKSQAGYLWSALENLCRQPREAIEVARFVIDNAVDATVFDELGKRVMTQPKCSTQVVLLLDRNLAPTPSALAVVSADGTPQSVVRIIKSGTDVNDKGQTPRYANPVTPLYAAATDLKVENVRTLLDAGADPNVIDDWTQQTPLLAVIEGGGGCSGHFSMCDHALEIVALLLERGARPDVADKRGNTAFDYVHKLGAAALPGQWPSARDKVVEMLSSRRHWIETPPTPARQSQNRVGGISPVPPFSGKDSHVYSICEPFTTNVPYCAAPGGDLLSDRPFPPNWRAGRFKGTDEK
jgi:hypothetical protein